MSINIEAEKRAYKKFRQAGMTAVGACGLIGNLEAESDGFYTNRVEYLCLKRLKENGKVYTDTTYTAAIDSGKISCEEFLHPLSGKQYGYGLAQWTSPSRKSGLWNFAKQRGVSIADEDMQLDFLLKELRESYSPVLAILKSATTIRQASDVVLKKFEIPANTGESVCESRSARGQKFYNDYVKGATNMTVQKKKDSAITWMEKSAEDNSHGYDQDNRWGPDYDCSSAVITAWEQAGVPVKTKGATYTGNMRSVFLKNGFIDVTTKINLATGAGLERSDVLLNETHHTAMYCGNGKEVEASINEKGTAHGGAKGDQTGREFLIRSYRNYPWTHVLRFTGGTAASKNYLEKGDSGSEVTTMQKMLIKVGYSCGSAGADGDFGSGTDEALRKFQKDNGLVVDGRYGTNSKAKLTALYNKKVGTTTSTKKDVTTVAKEVIAGKWGSGDERKKKLTAAGYNYDTVQKKVNELLKTSTKKSVAEVAEEVVSGKWGNGADRKKKLEAAGYNYSEVQKEVNKLLK